MLCRAVTGALAAASLSGAAEAAITQLELSGTGVLTYAQSGTVYGTPVSAPLESIGNPVRVTGVVNLGDGSRPDLAPVIPDGFTGVVALDPLALQLGYQSFQFLVQDGFIDADTLGTFAYASATLDLYGGHLRSFDFSIDTDPEVSTLSINRFERVVGTASWGGYWRYDQPDSMIPEPSTWAITILGFALAGAWLRRSQGEMRSVQRLQPHA